MPSHNITHRPFRKHLNCVPKRRWGFDIYFSGPHSGDVASNASFEEVREIVTRFFTGIYPEAVDCVEAAGEVPGVKKKDLLAYMPLYEYYDPFDVGGGREISFHVWREENGE